MPRIETKPGAKLGSLSNSSTLSDSTSQISCCVGHLAPLACSQEIVHTMAARRDKGKGKAHADGNRAGDEHAGEDRLASFFGNMPSDLYQEFFEEMEKRVRRSLEIKENEPGNSQEQQRRDDSVDSLKLLKARRRSSISESMSGAGESSRQGKKRAKKNKDPVISKRNVILSGSSSEEESDSDSQSAHSSDEGENEAKRDRDYPEDINLSYNVQFKKLSNSEVYYYKGMPFLDDAGKEFIEQATNAMKAYCHEVDKTWRQVKPRHRERALRYIIDNFGQGLTEFELNKLLAKRWRHYRDNLRRKVRAGKDCRPLKVSKEVWDRFVEQCGRVYQRQRDAAARRVTRQRTGSGGDMSIRSKFFNDWGTFPIDDLVRKIKDEGGYTVWKKKMIGKGYEVCKHKASDYVKKPSPGIVFKKKIKQEDTRNLKNQEPIYLDFEEVSEGEERNESNGKDPSSTKDDSLE